VVPHDTANVILSEGGMARIMRFWNRPGFEIPDQDTSRNLHIGDTPILQVMSLSKQPLIIEDTQKSPDWVGRPHSNWVRSYLGTPILIEKEVIGFINLNSATPGFFKNIHAESLKAFANQAAIAIKNARSFERGQELAAIKERQKLARDLHDAVSQTLWTASLIADVLPVLWDQDHAESLVNLEKLQRLVRGALAEMRTLLLELRPSALIRASLGDLIVQLSQAVMSRKKLHITVQVDGEIKLDPDVQVGFYRLAQESLNNVVKHAKATQVQINLQMNASQLHLSIQDNGRGFETTQEIHNGLGLGIMRERAATIGASLEISSKVGSGTLVKLIWPAVKLS
jgi:signal transduction histidine kinase